VDSWGVAKDNPYDFGEGSEGGSGRSGSQWEEEAASPGSTVGMERVMGTSLMIGWKKAVAGLYKSNSVK
jgi:hypothetical protein